MCKLILTLLITIITIIIIIGITEPVVINAEIVHPYTSNLNNNSEIHYKYNCNICNSDTCLYLKYNNDFKFINCSCSNTKCGDFCNGKSYFKEELLNKRLNPLFMFDFYSLGLFLSFCLVFISVIVIFVSFAIIMCIIVYVVAFIIFIIKIIANLNISIPIIEQLMQKLHYYKKLNGTDTENVQLDDVNDNCNDVNDVDNNYSDANNDNCNGANDNNKNNTDNIEKNYKNGCIVIGIIQIIICYAIFFGLYINMIVKINNLDLSIHCL
jgi:hypothetical protein